MDDARKLQYGIEFETGEAGSSIDELNQTIEQMEALLGAAEAGVQRFGASAVSACNSGQQGAQSLAASIGAAGDAIEDTEDSARTAADTAQLFGRGMGEAGEAAEEFGRRTGEAAEGAIRLGAGASEAGDSAGGFSDEVRTATDTARQFGQGAEDAGGEASRFGDSVRDAADAAQRFGSGADEAGEGAERLGQQARDAAGGAEELGAGAGAAGDGARDMADHLNDASDETRRFRREVEDAGEDAENFREQIRQTAEGAIDLGAAFRETMADGLDAGQSIAQSFRTGLTGAVDFSRKKVKTFISDATTGAKSIGAAFQHPIKTIKGALVNALRRAEDGVDDTGDAANDVERDLDDMGDAGEDAGNRVSEAIKSVVAAFIGFEAIKAGTEMLKNFAVAALGAYQQSETTAAQFGTLFTSEAAEWVDNYADAVHRSTSEVQSFMVENDAMYHNLGLTADASEELSKITTSLAYDFGNFFHMEDAEALSMLQGAIEGDTAALTKFGISLDDAALKQSAAELGLSKNLDTLDEAAAAQVRLNAILMQSGAIQQAAATQTGGLTNATKSLNGVMTDFLTNAGDKLAPGMESIINSVLDEWPALEPVLLSFVETLGDGLSTVSPVLVQLGKDLIPSLSKTLGTLLSASAPILDTVGNLAGTLLPPLASIIAELASTALPPLVDIFDTLNTTAIQPLMPVIEEVAGQLLPVLGMALSSVSSLVGPLISAFMPLLTTVLPVLATLISELAGSVIPPLTQILGVVIEALQPIVSIATEFVQALLPAVEPLISAIGTVLSGVVLPVLEALSPVLSFAADVLGTIAGWVSDLIGFFANGVSKVASFFSGIFGGAKESSEAVDGLTGSVNGLEDATGTETSLAVDTSEYSANISEASKTAEQAVTDATNAAREISNENYGLMADDAETAYARMTLGAEEAWERMTKAADNGASAIVASFGKIASAAQSVNSANVTVTGVSIPGNADGTDNWRGGWTRMNEEGGELAYLPSGTAIIPADKTDEIINNSTTTSTSETSFTDSSTFAPQISITLGGGGGDADLPETLGDTVLDMLEKWYQEKKEEEYHQRAMQSAHARS